MWKQRVMGHGEGKSLEAWAHEVGVRPSEKTESQQAPGLPGPGRCSGGTVSSVLARAGAGCGSVGDVTGAWLASAPLSPSLWT